MRFLLFVVTTALFVATPASAGETTWLMPPVDGVVSQRFQAPRMDWGPGHRGVDFTVSPGTAVRAARAGEVTFAGEVAGFPAVTIAHEDGSETTYSILLDVSVSEGERVVAGQWIGRVGEAHPGAGSGLHFGVKIEGAYVDPEAYLGPIDVGAAIHLAPLVWRPPDATGHVFDIEPGPQSWDPGCVSATKIERATVPPNDNIAIAIAGIGSHTEGGLSADMYEHGPELLGYPDDRIHRFSYRGSDGPRFHEPYAAADTYGDLTRAAEKLRDLVARVGSQHPGAQIDLIAHSQGGVVARAYLDLVASDWDVERPRIEHLVTLATPHGGAPVATLVPQLDERPIGRLIVDGLSHWASGGGPIPDPRSDAVAQLAPGSALMDELGRERTIFGTRVLTMAIPNDAIVPADRASYPGATSRTVAPTGLNGHSGIVTSTEARGIAYAFLRDAPPTCPTSWDSAGPLLGGLVGLVEENVVTLAGLALGP